MAGSLGVSSLVCLLNNGDQGNTETAQSLLGQNLYDRLRKLMGRRGIRLDEGRR